MPQSITIKEPDAETKYIVVDNDVVEVSSDMLDFVNDLDADATVTFYRNGRTKLANNHIKNFCEGFADSFPVTAGETHSCDVRKGIKDREYLYKVEATGYQPLDPVVILDRKGAGSSEGYSFLFLATAVVLAGVAAYTLGYRMAANKK